MGGVCEDLPKTPSSMLFVAILNKRCAFMELRCLLQSNHSTHKSVVMGKEECNSCVPLRKLEAWIRESPVSTQMQICNWEAFFFGQGS